MSLTAFNMGCNIIALEKSNHQFGMCAAWAQMLDYDVISVLIGESSVTGKQLQKGDFVGVSALASDQGAIANLFGEYHSDQFDKFATTKITNLEGALLIDNAKVMMKCQVLDIIHFDFSKNDVFAIFKILSYETNDAKAFLALTEV
jgi:flavin reductase (DIM6/NTAB) family NADH-FMN oxidoreductase RutF